MLPSCGNIVTWQQCPTGKRDATGRLFDLIINPISIVGNAKYIKNEKLSCMCTFSKIGSLVFIKALTQKQDEYANIIWKPGHDVSTENEQAL